MAASREAAAVGRAGELESRHGGMAAGGDPGGQGAVTGMGARRAHFNWDRKNLKFKISLNNLRCHN